MDVHRGMQGITREKLQEAHDADLRIQGDENVRFEHAWADASSGIVFCLSEAPDAEAVKRVHARAGHATDEVFRVDAEV